MANGNRQYCGKSDVKIYLGIGQDVDDILLDQIIDRATAIIEGFTHRVFVCSAATSQFLDGECDVTEDGRMLWLRGDLCSISYVKNGDGTTVAASQYVTEPRREPPYYALRMKWNANDPWLWSNTPEASIEVNGMWAYSATPPIQIIQATIRLAAFLYRQKDTTADLDRPLMSGDGVVIMPAKLPTDVMQLIKTYILEVR